VVVHLGLRERGGVIGERVLEWRDEDPLLLKQLPLIFINRHYSHLPHFVLLIGHIAGRLVRFIR
jgi:hypothetical protein